MSERFTMRVPAGEDSAFAPGAFDRMIGGTVTVQLDSGDAEGLVLAAEITSEGDAVMVTVALPDGTLPKQSLSGYSVP